MRRRRAFTLVLLTLLVPRQRPARGRSTAGLGRFALRVWSPRWRRWPLVVAVVFLLSQSLAIGVLGRGWVLTVLQWLLAGFAVLWAVLFVDAWRLGRPAGPSLLATRRWLTGVTAALLVVTSGGLVYAASTVGAGRDAMSALFQGNEAVGAVNGPLQHPAARGGLRSGPRRAPAPTASSWSASTPRRAAP